MVTYSNDIIQNLYDAFWAILCLNHQYDKCSKNYWCILIIRIYGRYLGVQPMVQFLFLMLWQPISEWYLRAWKYDMLVEMQCL